MLFLRIAARPIIIILLLLAIGLIATPLVMRAAVSPFTYTSITTVPDAQTAVILGASVINGKPSAILAARADMAIALYETGKVSKILITGDNGALNHDEVTPVRRYLSNAGIPDDDMFLDHAGFDTYSSMYRARTVFEAQSIIIVTQDFHLPRALYIARHLGITAYGVVADGQGKPFDYFREIPASNKALLDLIVHRVPQYLGSPFPLSGSGTSTWY